MANGALSALRRLSIVIAIAIVFVFGLATTVYLSLRSPEVQVPDVVGKDRLEAENILGDAGLNFRVRAYRPSSEVKAETVVFQLPRPGEIVKAGQTVAMDLSRGVKEGESSEAVVPEKTPEDKVGEKANQNANDSANENKPKRKPTNKNGNENSNSANANSNLGIRNANANANANANRQPANRNANVGNANTTTNATSNRPNVNTNTNRANQNENRRPTVPRATPAPKPNR
ncbi:MAG TPA: PASTA domain-containing protein [Pyrinomonadaceae bacterium]|nr:PASTA domain-containing protein [Pyrinomonadaceae bacterium]